MLDEKDNFFTGMMVGKLINGSGSSNESSHKGGFLSTLIIIILAVIIGSRFGIAGVIAAAIICFVIIPLVIAMVANANREAAKQAKEAWDLYEQGQFTLALEKAERTADKHEDAAFLAGALYLDGKGCTKNPEKAFSYFSSAKRKNHEAEAYYAICLLDGAGCEQDKEEGVKSLWKAAGHNVPLALMRLGEMQLHGEDGVERNVEAGMRNLRVAMDAGYAYARFVIGTALYNGIDGVPQNQQEGCAMIQEAADAGVPQARQFLADIAKLS